MADARVEAYARLLVERSVDVQPGWQVIVRSSPLARPLLEAIAGCLARRGAHMLTRLTYASIHNAWSSEASEALLEAVAPADMHAWETADALISIDAPENTRERADIPPERRVLLAKAGRLMHRRVMSGDMPWVGCQFPTSALAQDAGMSLSAYEDLLYSACLLDWDEQGRQMRRIADRFDQASLVRIVGEGTDLTVSLQGRLGMVDDGHRNMPGGEVFYCPLEDSADGVITYAEFPAVYGGQLVEGVRLRFEQGVVVEASARSGEEFLVKMLATDPGASRLGELGIGCNPGIQRHMKNTLFDEKIYGTVHLAVGNGFPFGGGTNVSSVHWDMVKDLRTGGQIYCDGELVQENGRWVF